MIGSKAVAFHLFLVGFLVLFLELAYIRWFAAHVIFLQFFTNVVLIACFLGMSCGCLADGSRRDWLAAFPTLGLLTFLAALGSLAIYTHQREVVVTVGSFTSPQEIFFGTESRNLDIAKFVVPIEFIAATFFVLIALLFVGLGQVLGRAFDAYPNRVLGYTLNISGSLVGIVAFSAVSFAQVPPVIWFLVGFSGVAYLLHQRGRLDWIRGLLLALIVILTAVPVGTLTSIGNKTTRGIKTRWSPYYAIVHNRDMHTITVNTIIGHQQMFPSTEKTMEYSLIHLLKKHIGAKPFEDVLVIGAGSGNDVACALQFGATRIDAVEIDPVIQDIGINYHPDHPYQDSRVVRHIDDGRHYLRTTDQKYDLVIYALVDSLILHSSYANIRLESYLFTEQAFDDVRHVLKPNGLFVMYNYYRKGWIVHRVAAMAEKVFGHKAIVISLPDRDSLSPDSNAGFTILIAGDNSRIAEAFAKQEALWGNQRVAPTKLVSLNVSQALPTDDWPFLYLQGRMLPMLNVDFMLLLGGLGVVMVYLFMPKGRIHGGKQMFFLGAAFMLLETKAVVQFALLFGSTWLVNSLVFFTVLVLILLANLFVIKKPTVQLRWHYVGLFILLTANVLIPLDVFLSYGIIWRYVLPCALTLGPMFFAGVVFAQLFRNNLHPAQALGANIAGSVVGGVIESFSMLLGFRYLLLLAMIFYALSVGRPKNVES
ncbi:MAG: hypothetical protein ABSA97_10705 [Verrucomicrobiia bacterium]